MDSRGIINVELLFCTLIMVLLLIMNFPMIEQNINSNLEISEDSESRSLLIHISDSINEVNSKEYGFNKKMRLPASINGNYYSITISSNEVVVESNNKKGKSYINPIKLTDSNNRTIDHVQLFCGRTYLIKKALISNNETNAINQSSILILQVGN